MEQVVVYLWKTRDLHGSKLAVHFSGSSMAMFRSTPDIGGPFTSTHKQGWPKALMALQQPSVGGIGLKGETDALQGISWTSAEKKVLPQGVAWPCHTNVVMTNINTNNGETLEPKSFMFELRLSPLLCAK